jgi:hypothetical protein
MKLTYQRNREAVLRTELRRETSAPAHHLSANPQWGDTARGTSMLFSCTITGSPTLTVS